MIRSVPPGKVLAGGMLLAAHACAGLAHAGVSISPVVVEMEPSRRPVTITVTNTGDRPITLQSETLSWRQPHGADQLEPTADLLVVPSIAQIPARGSQVFRVALRAPAASPVERAYRLMLEDVTQELATGRGTEVVAVRFNHNLPVMVAPSRPPQHAIEWKPCATSAQVQPMPAAHASAAGEVCVTLRNAGNRRMRVKSLSLSGDGWQEAIALPVPQVVLAGGQRSWRVPLRAASAGSVRALSAEVDSGLLRGQAASF